MSQEIAISTIRAEIALLEKKKRKLLKARENQQNEIFRFADSQQINKLRAQQMVLRKVCRTLMKIQ